MNEIRGEIHSLGLDVTGSIFVVGIMDMVR